MHESAESTLMDSAPMTQSKFTQNREGNQRILRKQRRRLREKMRLKKLENAPEAPRLTMEEHLTQARAAPKLVGMGNTSAAKLTHPTAQGYSLAPAHSGFDASETSPVFKGYFYESIDQRIAVVVEVKLFGCLVGQANGARLKEAIVDCLSELLLFVGCSVVRRENISVDVRNIEGDRLRRLIRKLDLRADKHSRREERKLADFHQEQKRLLKGRGGVNCTIKLPLSLMAKLFAINDAGVVETSLPFYDLSFDLLQQQREAAEELAKQLMPFFAGCSSIFQQKIRERIGVVDADILVGLAHAPRCEEAELNYRIPKDTPRARASDAKSLAFNVARRTNEGTGVNRKVSFRPEASLYVHPCFFGRPFDHPTYDATSTSPLFWAQYEREYVHDSRCHLDPRPTPEIYHPAFFQRIVVSEDELKHVRNRGGDRHLHPAFNGQREFPSSCFDRLEFHIDEDSGTSDSEVEETMVERRMKMGRVHARINAELAKELNVAGHPIYTGYKSMPPVFQGEVQYVHPAFFGFSPNERFQTRSVVEAIHPSCIGFHLSTKSSLLCSKEAAETVHPIFHGYVIQKGPRYQGVEKVVDANVKKRLAAVGQLGAIKGKVKEVCPICFGRAAATCPRCWQPNEDTAEKSDAPEEDGIVDVGSWKWIHRHRETVGVVTVYIKRLPVGQVVQVDVESTKTLQYLHFLYRSNSAASVGNQERLHLLLPTSKGLFLLDGSVKMQDDLNLAFKPGLRTLRDYGIDRKSEIVVLQTSHLERPDAASVIRLFLVQNINLDEENPALSGKDPFNRTRLNVSGEEPNGETMEKKRHLNRFGFGNEVSSGVAIKSKLGAIRMLDDSSSEDSTDTEESKKDPLDRFDFSVYTTIDNVPEKLPDDLLQRLLVNEMRDAIVRQELAGKEKLMVEAVSLRKQAKATQQPLNHDGIRKKAIPSNESEAEDKRSEIVPPLKLP